MRCVLKLRFSLLVLLCGGLLTANGGTTRIARSPPEVNCITPASNAYSSFNIEEEVTKEGNEPLKDGAVRIFYLVMMIKE